MKNKYHIPVIFHPFKFVHSLLSVLRISRNVLVDGRVRQSVRGVDDAGSTIIIPLQKNYNLLPKINNNEILYYN